MAASIFLVSLFCGAYAVVAQSYLAREFLVVFLGNEMSLAVMLAGWLAGVAAGARIARLGPFKRMRPVFLLSLALPAWMTALPAALTAIRASRGMILGIEPGMYAPLSKVLIAAVLFAGPFAAFGGFMFVVLCRAADDARVRANPVGLVYVAEAVGGVAGGAVFTFALAGNCDPYTFAFAAYLTQGAAFIALLWRSKTSKIIAARQATTIALGATLIAVAGGSLWATGRGRTLDANTHVERMLSIGQGVVAAVRESRYENVTAMVNSGQYTIYGNGEPLATFPEAALNEKEAHLVLTEQGDPKRVLVIGGGPDFLPAVLSYGVPSVDYVELDPAVVAVARPFLSDASRRALESESVHVHYGDAREFVGLAAVVGRRYDVIFLRLPDPVTLLLNRMYTREFLTLARSALSDNGVFVAPVTLADSYLSGEVGKYAGDVYRTMRGVFPEALVTPEVNSLFFAAARSGVLTSSAGELARRFSARGIHSELYPVLFAYAFPPELTADVNGALARMPGGAVNSDWRPTTYADNLALWARYSGSGLAGRLLQASQAPAWKVFAALAAAALVAAFAWGRKLRARAVAGMCVFSTGALAMSAMVMLIYAFQVERGYIYNWVGILVAAFVAGLSAGGFAAARGRCRLSGAELLAFVTPVVLMGGLALASLLAARAAEWLILALSASAGFTTGFEFPVAARTLAAGGLGAGDAGSRLEVADHLGACGGAMLTGIVMVPALGLWWSLAFLAFVKAVTAGFAIASEHGPS